MTDHFARGTLLFQQSKFDLAESELRQAIVLDPEHAGSHAVLGICLAAQKKFAEATREAETAIHLAPDHWSVHYAMAHVLWRRHRLKEARDAIEEAIRLNPSDATSWAVLGHIEYGMTNWSESLAAAERGLALDAEDDDCANVRSMALVKLGRRHEASAGIKDTLARDPDNALTQANQGWAMLEHGDYRRAMEHFREALRLEPTMDWARQGMVTALKARNPLYRLMLNYFLWMSKLSAKAQWAFIIGLYVAFRIVRQLSRQKPELQPVLLPLLIVYVGFVALSWLADPLFNLMLRLDRFGRYALSREQIRGANLVGACLLATLIGIGLALATGSGTGLVAALCAALMIIPCSAVFNCDEGWPRQVMSVYTMGMAALAVACVVGGLADSPLVGTLLMVFLIGAVASSWVANAMVSVSPRH